MEGVWTLMIVGWQNSPETPTPKREITHLLQYFWYLQSNMTDSSSA